MLKLGLILSILLTIPGELFRVPIGPGILINDIYLPLLVITWIFKKISIDRKFVPAKLALPLVIFVGTAIAGLLNSLTFLAPQETLEGAFYLIRFIEYAFLYIITIDLVRSKKDSRFIFASIVLTTLTLAILGFLQLRFFSDFRSMEDFGWDPHIGRLLSTWFDPNFIGGLFAFIGSILIGIILSTSKHRILLISILTIIVIALFLTYSRSGYISFATGIFIVGALKSKKFLATAILFALFIIPLTERAQTRIVNMYHSAKSLVTNSAETPDITVQHRLNSWKRSIQVYVEHPILGTGYNTFKYVQSKEGLITDINSHASSGSDASLLTILATTGPIGLLSFLSMFWIILRDTFKTRKQGLQLGVLGGTGALLVHSIFVNSLLFPHIMVFFWIMIGLSSVPKSSRTIQLPLSRQQNFPAHPNRPKAQSPPDHYFS